MLRLKELLEKKHKTQVWLSEELIGSIKILEQLLGNKKCITTLFCSDIEICISGLMLRQFKKYNVKTFIYSNSLF